MRWAALLPLLWFGGCLTGCSYGSESYNQETWRLTIGSPLVIELQRDANGDPNKPNVAGTSITMGKPKSIGPPEPTEQEAVEAAESD